MTVSSPAGQDAIFISYRTGGGSLAAGRLHGRLAHHFSSRQVFYAPDGIPLARNFADMINNALRSCMLLALTGDRGLTVPDRDERRRLHGPRDYARMEIETGLARRNVQVVPIVVGGARMPSADELPGRLATLPRLEALELSLRHFDIDTGWLIGELNKIIPRRVVAVAPLALGIPLFVLAPHFAGGSLGMHWPWIVLVGVVLGATVAAVDYRRSTVWLVTIETTLIWSISCITYRLDLGHIHYLLPWNHGAWPVNPGAKYLAIAAGTAAITNIAILLVLARPSRKQRVVHVLLPVFLGCMVVGLGLKAFGYVSNTGIHANRWIFLAALVANIFAPLAVLTEAIGLVGQPICRQCASPGADTPARPACGPKTERPVAMWMAVSKPRSALIPAEAIATLAGGNRGLECG